MASSQALFRRRRERSSLYVRASVMALLMVCVLAGTASAESPYREPARLPSAAGTSGHLSGRADARSQAAVRGIKTVQKVIALTFDDGPDPKYTPAVLELAREAKIKLTFFLVGEQIQLYPELARREVAEGHAIGNHTWDHHVMTSLSQRQDLSEIQRCEDEIEQVCGQRTRLFRPPKGLFDDHTLSAAAALGYRTVLWSVALEHHHRNPQQMAQRVIEMARPGMIILAHDGEIGHPTDRSRTLQALAILVAGLQQKGYRFVTVPELLEAETEK